MVSTSNRALVCHAAVCHDHKRTSSLRFRFRVKAEVRHDQAPRPARHPALSLRGGELGHVGEGGEGALPGGEPGAYVEERGAGAALDDAAAEAAEAEAAGGETVGDGLRYARYVTCLARHVTRQGRRRNTRWARAGRRNVLPASVPAGAMRFGAETETALRRRDVHALRRRDVHALRDERSAHTARYPQ